LRQLDEQRIGRGVEPGATSLMSASAAVQPAVGVAASCHMQEDARAGARPVVGVVPDDGADGVALSGRSMSSQDAQSIRATRD
jgi:hypothetical protein